MGVHDHTVQELIESSLWLSGEGDTERWAAAEREHGRRQEFKRAVAEQPDRYHTLWRREVERLACWQYRMIKGRDHPPYSPFYDTCKRLRREEYT